MASFGLTLPNRGVLLGAVTVSEILDLAERADGSGAFAAIWVGDSILAKARLEAVALLGALAARTSRVRLGVGCLASFPHRHPVLFALQWASLDVLSAGRMVLAACIGGPDAQGPTFVLENRTMGVKSAERVARLEEGIEILRALWSGDQATHAGQFYRFDHVNLEPKPVQRPCPIWIANNPTSATYKRGAPGGNVERMMRRVARLADGWMTNRMKPSTFRELFHGEPMHSGFHTTWVPDTRPLLNPHSTKTPPDAGEVTGQVLHERSVAAGTIGIVGERVMPAAVQRGLSRAAPAATWRSADHLLARMRRIKSPREIEVYRQAGRATDAGFVAAIEAVRPGVTEFEIASRMVGAAIAAGGRPRAGGTVQCGDRTSLKNIGPSHRLVREGDLIFLDNPSSVGGYWTDAARNVVVGTPLPDVRQMLETVLEQNERLRCAIRPGARISDLQRLMREIAERAGLGQWDYTELCCAHSGGLSLVEEPMWWWGNPERLEPGMTFYLEPMIIKHGVGTACIEDVILVTDDGCESLTSAPRRNW